MKHRGFGITTLFAGMFGIAAVIMALFVAEVKKADLYVGEQRRIEENRRLCERESQALSEGSDYLTDEVWRFVATRRVEYMDNYWDEVNEGRKRDTAMEHLTALSLTDREESLMKEAKLESDRLIADETWAMRLIADSIGMDLGNMPPEVRAVTYTQGEEHLSPVEKAELATGYIFGGEYTASKQDIKDSIASFVHLLRERKNDELAGYAARTQSALEMVRMLMAALILILVLEALLFYHFILRPFYHYMRLLAPSKGRETSPLTPMGTWEMKAFARIFNQTYEGWQEEKRNLEKERNRFHTALENMSVVIYEYDVPSDTCFAYGNLENHGEEHKKERTVGHFMGRYIPSVMSASDAERLSSMMQDTGAPVDIQVRPSLKSGRHIWVRVAGTPVYDDNRKLVKVIGRISNIQAEKEQALALEDARSRDRLTGFYNREPGVTRVRKYMAGKPEEEICCIMLMDMDGFGKINEEEGQIFADAILQDAADVVRAETGPEDILVRLGGDEFMMCIKNCTKARAGILGPEIAALIAGLSVQYNSGLKISASIGMCVSEVVDEYSGLYRCAESTLNYVKEHGKGYAACYLDSSNEMGMFLTQMYPGKHFVNEIERPEAEWENLPSFALNLLGKSRNLDDAVFLLLSRTGRMCGMDRILIIQVDYEYLGSRVVYQWARTPKDRQTVPVIYFTQEKLQEIAGSYDAQGLCERRVISGNGGMKSILHAAMWNYGNCVGAMSFEMRKTHQWTKQERELLSELTKIIASFILKAKADAVSQAKTDFLSRMSHEIRTPMNAISGMTVIAKTALNDPQRTMDCLNKIESANRYLMSLINDVLDMSRIESGRLEIHKEAMSLERLTVNIDTLIRPQAEARQQTFELRNGFSGKCLVMADELRLNQVLVNLLGNAVKFTGKGGCVTLDISPGDYGAGDIKIRFCVSDTGIGISPEAQERIFNAFEQEGSDTVSRYGGSGLGLAISSHLVQLMGGKLEVQSRQGEGSCFYFTVPMEYADSGEAKEDVFETDVDGHTFEPNGKRLLLAEDNELNREIAREILSMHGFSVEEAVDGKEAVDLFGEREPWYYDAILMDIRMPVMGGMEATRRIRTMQKPDSRTIPIIAMTANAFDEDMRKSLENGMDGHLSKPVDVDKLLKMLRQLIHTRTTG